MTSTPAKLELYQTKDFDRRLRALARKSGEGERVHRQVVAALHDWSNGRAPALSVTHHGESRVPHVVKYDLQGHYRLVVYEHEGARIPLFVGDHDDTDRWLNNNRGRDFTIDRQTKKITFTSVSSDKAAVDAAKENLRPPPTASGPILDRLPADVLPSLGLDESTLQAMRQFVTFEEVEEDRTWTLLSALPFPAEEIRAAVIQAIAHVARGRVDEAIATLRHAAGRATTATASPEEFDHALESGDNSDSLVRLTALEPADLERILNSHSVAEWMLFLHPKQKRLVEREFKGPARLIGVSGSGKTAVLVHRAVQLARRYPGQPVLVLCLNTALCQLIDYLLTSLCPPELRSQISAQSIYDYCYRAVKTIDPGRLIEKEDRISGETLAICWRDFLEKEHARAMIRPVFEAIEAREDKVDARSYLLDELIWIRSGFGNADRSSYLTCERTGRGIPLPRYIPERQTGDARTDAGVPLDTRKRILDLLDAYEEYMRDGGLLDEEGVSLDAFAVKDRIAQHPELRARCVLVDEVQDCSTVELAVIASIPTDPADGLFLVGDPVQKVLPRQHDLASAGIDIVGRATVLHQNYRNTRQILEAAFTIIRRFVSESPVPESEVLEPEFAFRDGSRPCLYECESREQQVRLVMSYLDHYTPEELGSIGVCSASAATLDLFEEACRKKGVRVSRLSGQREFGADGVHTAILEHVKGFEFEKVFILDLSDSVLPSSGLPWEERWRDAFQLYVAMTRARDELVMTYVYNRTILLGPLHDTVTEHHAAAWLNDGPRQ